jgi:hypothetical protein
MTARTARTAASDGIARAALRDFIVLGGKALAAGLMAAVVLGCGALLLASHGSAATMEAAGATPAAEGPAQIPATNAAPLRFAAVAGSRAEGGTIPQTDGAATLHLVLGLMALGAAASVAAIGRSAA